MIVNLIKNPSFETNDTGMAVDLGLGTRLSLSAARIFGTWGYALTNSGGGMAHYTTDNLVSGRTYTVSYYVRKGVSGATGSVDLIHNGSTIHTNNSVTDTNPMTRYSYTFTATANSPLEIHFYISPSDSAIFTDGLMLTEGSTLHPYFDGSFAEDSNYKYLWTGTAHASSSVRIEKKNGAFFQVF